MRRTLALVESGLFFVLAPATVAGAIPWWISRWRVEASSIARVLLGVIGGLLALTRFAAWND